ncbi:pseudouridine synthase, partial [Microvirga antarctica]|uniref:pseudouridine synthase n=1 Tax=Microvirga antarctica TaxID=2819233 RepID=UPI001B314A5C
MRPRPETGDAPFRPRREESDRPARGRDSASRTPRAAPRAAEAPRSAREVQLAAQAMEPVEDRIAKVIARAGIASRRDVEAMIAEGRVTLNGKVLESPAINVTPADLITVDGEPLPVKERTRLWLYHKPRGLVTTARDPEGRATVFDNLPEDLPRVVAIGRLDINTEGLLLLTNDGGLARVIAHPNTGWLRRYKVRAHGEVNQAELDKLRDGITIDGMEYGPIEARLDRVQGDNAWISLGLREGKNREVKRILEHLGLQVNRLIRLSFGPFQLGELEEGMAEEVKTKILRDQLGEALAIEAGVDFESPVRDLIAPFGSPSKDENHEHAERPARPARERSDDRPARPSRERNEDRPARPARERGDDRAARPFRDRSEDRPARPRQDDDRPRRGRDEEEAPRKFPSRLENKTSIWRANADEDAGSKKIPRRGADPRAARTASGERPRERMSAIESGEGRKVMVERLVSAPREEAPAAEPRRVKVRGAFGNRAPSGDDRPRRRPERDESAPRRDFTSSDSRPPRRDDDRPARPSGERPPFRARPEAGERAHRPAGDRPFRSRDGDSERPRGPRPEGGRSEGGRPPFRARPDVGERAHRPAGDRPFRAREGDSER